DAACCGTIVRTLGTRVVVLSLWLLFFNDPATTEIYTLSLHDALPILFKFRSTCESRAYRLGYLDENVSNQPRSGRRPRDYGNVEDRKSTRLNSSHVKISYAVFCLKKKRHRHHAPRAHCNGIRRVPAR